MTAWSGTGADANARGSSSPRGLSVLGLVIVGIGVALAFLALPLPKLAVETHLQHTGISSGSLGKVVPLTGNSMLGNGSGILIILCGLIGAVGFWLHYRTGERTFTPLVAGAGLIAIAIYQSTGSRLYITANIDSYWRFAKGTPTSGLHAIWLAGVLLIVGGVLCAKLPELGRARRASPGSP